MLGFLGITIAAFFGTSIAYAGKTTQNHNKSAASAIKKAKKSEDVVVVPSNASATH